VGDDNTPNQLEPANLNTGITIVGKRARIPAGATIGRNCRIDPNVTPDDFEQLDILSAAVVARG
jgi:glucose-1-phosphate adenylyltransferase